MRVGDKDYPRYSHAREVWITRGGYKLVEEPGMFGQARWSLIGRDGITIATQTELFPKEPLFSGPPLNWANSFL